MRPQWKRIAAVACLAFAGVGAAAYAGVLRPDPAQGAASPPAGITVLGTGTVRAAPDQASFSFGVESQASSAAAAMEANAATVRSVIDAVKRAGVPAADIQTQQVAISPRYAENGQTIIGYSATNVVQVTIRDLDQVSTVVEAATKAGANQVNGPSLTIAESSGLYAQALAKALADARAKAEALAQAAGVALGGVTNVVEGGVEPPAPLPERAAAADAASVPIEPGRQEITATIAVTYAIR